MNVLIISNLFPNIQFPTNGIFVKEQVTALKKLGINITVISPIPYVFPFIKNFNKKWTKYKYIKTEESFEDLKVYHPRFVAIPGGILKQYWFIVLFLSSKKLLKKLHFDKKFDLIHIHGSAPDDYTGLKISQLLRIPYILTIHGDSVLSLAKNKRRFKSTKIAIERANAVIAVSSKVKNEIIKLTDRTENIFVIHNGYAKVTNMKIVKDNNSKTVTILFVGNLIPQKGCRNLILAINKIITRFKNITLKIVGSGPEGEALKKLVKDLNLSEIVSFWGSQPHDKVLKFMQECDIFILPSINEAFGVVYLEAMSFKKPVIGSLDEGIGDLIEDGRNGFLVNPKNVKSIIEKLEILLSDKRKRIELGQKGYNTIKGLTWENNARRNIEIYKLVTNMKE